MQFIHISIFTMNPHKYHILASILTMDIYDAKARSYITSIHAFL